MKAGFYFNYLFFLNVVKNPAKIPLWEEGGEGWRKKGKGGGGVWRDEEGGEGVEVWKERWDEGGEVVGGGTQRCLATPSTSAISHMF